jgi:hypothetical protein
MIVIAIAPQLFDIILHCRGEHSLSFAELAVFEFYSRTKWLVPKPIVLPAAALIVGAVCKMLY